MRCQVDSAPRPGGRSPSLTRLLLVGRSRYHKVTETVRVPSMGRTLDQIMEHKDAPGMRALKSLCRGGGISSVPSMGRTLDQIVEHKGAPGMRALEIVCRGGGISSVPSMGRTLDRIVERKGAPGMRALKSLCRGGGIS